MISPAQAEEALVVSDLSKTFGGQPALDAVDLSIRSGEIHALLGQNGSGKSTLIKILAGYHQPDPGGKVTLQGEPFRLGSASAAHAAGLRFIHQDLGLIGSQDTVDNLALGSTYAGRFWISDRREEKLARKLLAEYGIEFDVAAPLETLTPAQETMVAIVRALKEGIGTGGILVLDEPTVSLPAQDVSLLFGLVRQVRDRGAAVIYVTHRLGEVFEIADRVSVLRDGRRVATEVVADLDQDYLAQLIIGRSMDTFYPEIPDPEADVVLEVEGLRSGALRGVSLQLRRGEVLGVTGLVGSGFEELLHVIFGAKQPHAGSVAIGGQAVSPINPSNSIAAGIAFAPADRKRQGAVMPWTLRENLTLPALRGRGPARWLSYRAERREAAEWLERLAVSPAAPEAMFSSLSGGNQQRVVMARWLRCGAKVFLLDEPTSGIDVGGKHDLYEYLAEAAREGAGLLVSSSDYEELCAICDRVLVLRQGLVVAELQSQRLTVEDVLAASLDRKSTARTAEVNDV